MKAIWCAKDRNKALDDAMNERRAAGELQRRISPNITPLGVQMGVNGYAGDGPQ